MMKNEIMDIVKNYLEAGYSEAQIKQALQREGLDEKSIDKIIKNAEPPQEVKKSNKIIFLIIGLTIFILLVSMIYVFYTSKPRTTEGYIKSGEKYFNKGYYDKALEDFNKAKELEPNNHVIYYWLSSVSYKKEKYEEALQLIDKAVELDPNNPSIHRLKGWVYYELKYYDKALEEFKKTLELNPSLSNKKSAYRGIGIIYLEYLENQT